MQFPWTTYVIDDRVHGFSVPTPGLIGVLKQGGSYSAIMKLLEFSVEEFEKVKHADYYSFLNSERESFTISAYQELEIERNARKQSLTNGHNLPLDV